MKKSVICLIIIFSILSLSIFITAVVNKNESWHDSENILVTVGSYQMSLSEAISNNVFTDGATQSYTSALQNPGHSSNEIWISVDGNEKTLQNALSAQNGICGSSVTNSYSSTPTNLVYQFAKEIEISFNTSLQDAIDNGDFCHYDLILSKPSSAFEFDTTYASYNSLQKIDSTHYLNVYTGISGSSYTKRAVVLQVNPSTWQISKPTSELQSNIYGIWNSLEQIDSNHYINTYLGDDSDGYALVLEVNPSTWQVSTYTPFEFDTTFAQFNAIKKIDSTHYLNIYKGNDQNYAVVLQVNPSTWQISKPSSAFGFTGEGMNSLEQIDSTHYLATYSGILSRGYAVVLQVNPSTWQVSANTPFEFHSSAVESNSLQKIDSTHYLNVYEATSGNYGGYAVVLQVNPSTWQISKPSSAFEFDFIQARDNSLQKIDSTHFLNTYRGNNNKDYAAVLQVNPSTWQISKPVDSFEFDSASSNYKYNSLQKIDSTHFLNTYYSTDEDGYAVVLQIY